jgi:hypothetical protein
MQNYIRVILISGALAALVAGCGTLSHPAVARSERDVFARYAMSRKEIRMCLQFKSARGRERFQEALAVHNILDQFKVVGKLPLRDLTIMIGEPDKADLHDGNGEFTYSTDAGGHGQKFMTLLIRDNFFLTQGGWGAIVE